MASDKTKFDESQIHLLSGGRTTLDSQKRPFICSDKIIDFDIDLSSLLNTNEGVYIIDLYFTSCIFKGSLRVGNYNCAGNLFFKDCTFEKDVVVESNRNIQFEVPNHFNQKLEIRSVCNGSQIRNFTIDGTLDITSNEDFSIFGINNEIKRQNLIVRASSQFVVVSECRFAEVELYSNLSGESCISFSNGSAYYLSAYAGYEGFKLKIFDSEISRIENSNMIPTKRYSIECDKCKSIANFQFLMDDVIKASIKDCKIEFLSTRGIISVDSSLTVHNCDISEVEFDGVINHGLIRFAEVRVQDRISMNYCNLGNGEFINCNFSSAVFGFKNSRISNIFLAETDFSKNVIDGGEYKDAYKSFVQAQLAFGQLRTVFERHGDTVRALEYQAREIEAHYRNIPFFGGEEPPSSILPSSIWV